MTAFAKHPATRWLVPAVALTLPLAGGLAMTRAQANDGLEHRSAEQLLVDLQASRVEQYAGTVETKVDLGLGQLSGMTSRATTFTSLADGTNTLRVWADGTDRQRVALLGDAGQADVVRNGTSVWMWNAEERTAQHATLDSEAHRAAGKHEKPDTPAGHASELPSTPQEAAQLALDHLEPTTEVTTSGTATVAGRPAYSLTLDPKDEATLVDRVTIDLDAETSMPLRVRVAATGSGSPVVSIGFTTLSLGAPDASVFEFTPPKDATVTEAGHASSTAAAKGKHPSGQHDAASREESRKALQQATAHIGSGWSSVTVAALPADAVARITAPEGDSDESGAASQAAAMLQALPAVKGSWGSGKVFEGTLFTAILTDDGRVAVGAVGADELQKALGTPQAKAVSAHR
ncbi:outer membrane lipoprotein carrier protein LolA [Luteococcus sediminum]